MILIIDNFDSFVFNLARYVEITGNHTMIVRNNQFTIADIKKLNPSHIIISPGPCTPNEAGISLQIVHELHKFYPILGVCLGHQVIGQTFSASVTNAKTPMHGKSSLITHCKNSTIFNNIPQKFKAGRYHSLIVKQSIKSNNWIKITAISPDNEVMAIEHIKYPTFGVQFHPESILTEHGMQIIENFVKISI